DIVMNDPLKEFVKQHREAFDQLEPPAGVMQRLRAQLKPEPTMPEPTRKHHVFGRYRRTAWLVAASLLIGLVCAYLFFDEAQIRRNTEPQIVHQPVDARFAVRCYAVSALHRKTGMRRPARSIATPRPARRYADTAQKHGASS